MSILETHENQTHSINIHLLNSEGYFISINTDSVHDLQIEDNFLRWWVTGYIEIYNEFDFLEKSMLATGKVNDISEISSESLMVNTDTNALYSFRNDGEDYLIINIEVHKAENDIHHTIQYILNIYNIEDVVNVTQSDKRKRLFFTDEKYHKLRHTNLDWSTADETSNPRHAPDSDRSMLTGYAIKYMLTQALGDETRFDIGWDNGSTNILYTSSTNSKCSDDLDYILADHVSTSSSGLSRCVLMFDRSYKMWRLVSLHDIFSHAAHFNAQNDTYTPGDLQLERFQLLTESTGVETEERSTPSTNRIPRGSDGSYINISLDESSIIQTIKFNEMSGTDNLEYLTTTPVHIHNNKSKTFHIKQKEHSLKCVYKKVTDLMAGMTTLPGNDTSVSMDIRKTRQNNTNTRHVYSNGDNENSLTLYNRSLNNNTFKSVMLSNSVEFTCTGQPVRQSGRFISIDPHSDSTDQTVSPYHNKVYGQYLVVSCVHRILKGDYTNKIVGIKPYNYTSVHMDPILNEKETFNTYEQSTQEES